VICLTQPIRLPNDYPTISVSRRMCLISLRFRLDSSRRSIEAWVGLVLCRGLGGSTAFWMRCIKRSLAAQRFRSCERYCLASMIRIPAEVMRLPAILAKRCFTSSGKDEVSWTFNLNWTAEDTLLTFWPPGPGERMKTNSISCSSMCIDGVISIINQV
jgi:hypothetical protein